jgi:hypothetical protein
MSVCVAASGCPIREQLVSVFKGRMDHYNNTFALLLDETPMAEATKEVQGIYDACVEARKQLVEHEREHECIPAPQMISVK